MNVAVFKICLFLWVIGTSICFADIYCDGESECTGQNITHLSGNVECNGFDSCRNAQISSRSTLIAAGAYSAFGATLLTDSAICYGEFSCANVDYLQNYQTVECGGYKSCFDINITLATSNVSISYLYTTGYASGASSTLNLYQNTEITTSAALSLYKSTINMYQSSTILAYAYFGLTSANLYCETNQTCTIECYGYGCANISSATGNGTYNVTCTDNFVSNVLCDQVTNTLTIDFDHDFPSALIDALFRPNIEQDSNLEDRIYLMYKNLSRPNVLGINCGDSQECQNLNDTLNYHNRAICCTSYAGCYDSSGLLSINTTLMNNKQNDSNFDLIGFYCGGYDSCADFNGDNIVHEIMLDILENTLHNYSYDIRCNGVTSCDNVKLDDADNLFCGAAGGCYRSTISSITTIYGTGHASLQSASISNTIGDIYCIADSACMFAMLRETGGNIYGIGYRSLMFGNVSNSVDNTIIEKMYVVGSSSGFLITINNVKSLYAFGFEALFVGDISGIRNLYVNGDEALSFSTITTGLSINDNSTDSMVILDIDGNNNYFYDVKCSSGDECFIYCRSNTSCTRMTLTCNGICYIDCGNYTSGYTYNQCPHNISGTWYGGIPTQVPTQIPTAIPTTISTNKQTVFPTPQTSFSTSTVIIIITHLLCQQFLGACT